MSLVCRRDTQELPALARPEYRTHAVTGKTEDYEDLEKTDPAVITDMKKFW